MAYIYNLTDTWNAAGTTFAGIKMAVTNTASSASSNLLDLTVSGATTASFIVNKSGALSLNGTITLSGSASGTVTLQTAAAAGTGTIFQFPSANGASSTILTTSGSGVTAWSTATYPTTAATGTILAAGSTDTISATATPTIGTSLTVPLISGGSAAGSTLTIQSTSGAGTSDSIVFRTASQSAALTLGSDGTTVLGTTAKSALVNARGNLQVTNNLVVTGTSPDNWLYKTDAATDEKIWDYFASGTASAGSGVLTFRTLNDAISAARTWMAVSRTGMDIDFIRLFTGASAEVMRLDSSRNLLLGTTVSPTSGTQCLTIETGTAATASPADTITIYSTDLSAGNTMLSLYTEGTPVNVNAIADATHRIAIRVNGTVYYLLANTSA
jgi:hypothetical protein